MSSIIDRTQNSNPNRLVIKNGVMHSRKCCTRLSRVVSRSCFVELKRLLSNTKPIIGVTKIPPN